MSDLKKKEDAVKHTCFPQKSYIFILIRAFNLLKRHHRIVVTEKKMIFAEEEERRENPREAAGILSILTFG